MLSLRFSILNHQNVNFFENTVITRFPNLTSKENDVFKSDNFNIYKHALKYLGILFDYGNSPFKLLSCFKLCELPKIIDLFNLAKSNDNRINRDKLYEAMNFIKLLPNDILNKNLLVRNNKQHFFDYLHHS